jgi:hypothetical protein
MRRPSAIFALLLLAAPAPALAWGAAGHAIVAEIAEARLSGPALTQIYNLLAVDLHGHLEEVASWADAWREAHKETGAWHFVDIPIDAASYDPARDCKDGACVVAKLAEYEAILADRSQKVAARVEALKYVVHFVGDVHQPLHAGENHDQGGNRVKVSYFGQATVYGKLPMNLHAVWDSAMLDRRLKIQEGFDLHVAELQAATTGFAATLSSGIGPRQAADWTRPGFAPVRWANEAHDLARDVAYRGIAAPGQASPGGPVELGEAYDVAAWPTVELQLGRGGVRLAAALDQALGAKAGKRPKR